MDISADSSANDFLLGYFIFNSFSRLFLEYFDVQANSWYFFIELLKNYFFSYNQNGKLLDMSSDSSIKNRYDVHVFAINLCF